MRRIAFIVRWIFAILAGSPMAAAAAPFSDLIVFGDSLSDNGNAGRFSNGPVWVERMAETLGLKLQPARAGGTNYAVGGARTQGGFIDVLSQTSAFVTQRRADPNALYIVFAGANDLLGSACGASDARVAREAAEALGVAIDRLAEAGAVHLLVPNLPDIGRAPIVRAQGADCAENARALTQTYNAALDRVLAKVQAQRQIRLLRLDVFSLADDVFANPKDAGFRDVTTPCHGVNCDGALFWDQLHPTTQAHSLLARQALGALGIDSP
jgi:outer membrane lipase/esterase